MFLIDKQPTCTWSYTSAGRGKRTSETRLGFFVIEHIATGKLVVGHSKTVSAEVDRQIEALMQGKHPCKAMCKQVEMDMDLKLYEYPAVGIGNAKDCVKQIKQSVYPDYLLLNPKG